MLQTAALILAAGKGTRMHSDKPKVLQTVLGEPMLRYVLEAVRPVFDGRVLVVVGHQAGMVEAAFPDAAFVRQEQQLGTGHARAGRTVRACAGGQRRYAIALRGRGTPLRGGLGRGRPGLCHHRAGRSRRLWPGGACRRGRRAGHRGGQGLRPRAVRARTARGQRGHVLRAPGSGGPSAAAHRQCQQERRILHHRPHLPGRGRGLQGAGRAVRPGREPDGRQFAPGTFPQRRMFAWACGGRPAAFRRDAACARAGTDQPAGHGGTGRGDHGPVRDLRPQRGAPGRPHRLPLRAARYRHRSRGGDPLLLPF